jgi:hypothetical protein
MVEAADRIQAVTHERRFDGFGSIELSRDGHSVTLYWKGPLPREMDELVDELRREVAIDVRDAPYSRRELRDETNRINDLDLPGLRITSVGPLGDCSGLRVTVDEGNDLAKASREIKSRMRMEFGVQRPATAIPAGRVTPRPFADRRPHASERLPDSAASADN